MIKFNLKQALAGRKLVTRSGIEVDQIAHFPTNVLYPLVVHLKGYDSVYQVDEDGTVPPHSNFSYSVKERREYDLFLVPQKRTMFVNIYEGHSSAGVFDTFEDANDNADSILLKLIARAVPVVVKE
jgi:hypothetical protein